MSRLAHDVRFALRTLATHRGHSAVAVLALGLGVALVATMFSLVHGIFLRGLPFDDAHRLLQLGNDKPAENVSDMQVSPRDFTAWREQLASFEDLAGWMGFSFTVTGGGHPAEARTGAYVSPQLFDLLRVRPVLGRAFMEGDGAAVVISHRVWRDRFGGDHDVLGQTLRFSGRTRTVVGVMPEGFHFPLSFDFWFPLEIDPSAGERRFGVGLQVVGRLRDGVSRQAAQAELDTVAARLARAYPETNEGVGAVARPYVAAYSDAEMRSSLMAMQGVVFAVLLVACANVANLFLARGVRRARELAVRQALGARRRHIVGQLLVESLVLAGAGGLLGLALTYAATGKFHDLVQPQLMSFWVDIRVDPWIVAFVAGVSIASGLVAGLVPAWRASGRRLDEGLKERSGSPGRGAGRLGTVFTAVQIALSCALLVVTGLILKSFVRMSDGEANEAAAEVWTGHLWLTDRHVYPDDDSRRRFADRLLEGVSTLPEVRGAGLRTFPPQVRGVDLESPSKPRTETAEWTIVSSGFFSAFGVATVEGRELLASDGPRSERVAVVDRSFARRWFGPAGALGRRIRQAGEDDAPWIRIVGVVPDGVFEAPRRPRRVWGVLPTLGRDDGAARHQEPAARAGHVYLPLAQHPSYVVQVALRTWGRPLEITPRVREIVAAIDPELPVRMVGTMRQGLLAGTWDYRLFGGLFVVFGAVALVLAMVGLYGVMAFYVGQRTRELGIRMALGARGADVVGLTLAKGSVALGVGLAGGLVAAAFLSRLLEALLYRVEPWDGSIFLAGAIGLVASGLLACWIPARRAARVDPMSVLRCE